MVWACSRKSVKVWEQLRCACHVANTAVRRDVSLRRLPINYIFRGYVAHEGDAPLGRLYAGYSVQRANKRSTLTSLVYSYLITCLLFLGYKVLRSLRLWGFKVTNPDGLSFIRLRSSATQSPFSAWLFLLSPFSFLLFHRSSTKNLTKSLSSFF